MRFPFLLFFTTAIVAGAAADMPAFHIYAPSRTTEQLLIVEAQQRDDGLHLELVERCDLGIPAGTIVSHPDKPILYAAPPAGPVGETPLAVIHLDDRGRYQRHTLPAVEHGYAYLSLDRTRSFLLGANYRDGYVDVYKLDRLGEPAARVGSLDEGRRNAHCVLPTLDNRFVYIPYVKETNALYQYTFDPGSGALQPLTPKDAGPPEGTGPRHIAYHPQLPRVYFSNEQHLGVSVYDKQPDGQLKLRQVCDAIDPSVSKQGLSSSDIVITADGRYLFAGIRGHTREFDWIARYRVRDEGDVEFLGLTPADKIPWGLALSPDGRYLLVTAFEGGTLTAYTVDDSGQLRVAARMTCDTKISDLVTR